MRRILMISGIIFLLAMATPGCNKSSDNQGPTTGDQPAEDVVKSATSEIKDAADEAQPAMTDSQPAEVAAETTPEASPKAMAEPASTTVADVIEMKHTAAFATHTKGIVLFEHKKHLSPAPDGYGLACGECHHDKDGQPLQLQAGDPVQGCLTCHTKAERPKRPTGTSKEEWAALQLEYFYGAIHTNCIDCHRAGNAGPVKCTECHPAQAR